jgi:hypothetical protein
MHRIIDLHHQTCLHIGPVTVPPVLTALKAAGWHVQLKVVPRCRFNVSVNCQTLSLFLLPFFCFCCVAGLLLP